MEIRSGRLLLFTFALAAVVLNVATGRSIRAEQSRAQCLFR